MKLKPEFELVVFCDSIATGRAIKAWCWASFFRFYKKKQGTKTVTALLQLTIFSPWSCINDRCRRRRRSNWLWSLRSRSLQLTNQPNKMILRILEYLWHNQHSKRHLPWLCGLFEERMITWNYHHSWIACSWVSWRSSRGFAPRFTLQKLTETSFSTNAQLIKFKKNAHSSSLKARWTLFGE